MNNNQINDIQMYDQATQQQQIPTYPSYLSIPKIRVIVRKRPLNKKEVSKGDNDVVEIRGKRQVVVKELKQKVDLTKYIEEHSFQFDLAFNESTTNEQIYVETVRPMIEAAFNKTKVTCFAYGQTGSGKTYTMMGNNIYNNNTTPGMYLLAAYDIFTLLQQEQYQNFTIWASFYEIYCGKLFDLLNERNQLQAREDGKQNICIVGLTEQNVQNLQSLMNLIEYGLKARTVGVTGANSDSSRSHGIIQITIKNSAGNQHGKISFIDLAGSERAADTIDTNRQTRIDGAEINKSLLALKECIRALDQDKKHTPFRGSKLTLVLRDSFVGNCKTLMIANISPSLICSEHTLNTLRYADRVKELRGKPDINIGSGNVNLNYDKDATVGKDPQEVLANLLMMPRQHNKTVKYTVDGNMKRISEKKIGLKKGTRKGINSHNRQESKQTFNTVNSMNNSTNNLLFGNGFNLNIPPMVQNNPVMNTNNTNNIVNNVSMMPQVMNQINSNVGMNMNKNSFSGMNNQNVMNQSNSNMSINMNNNSFSNMNNQNASNQTNSNVGMNMNMNNNSFSSINNQNVLNQSKSNGMNMNMNNNSFSNGNMNNQNITNQTNTNVGMNMTQLPQNLNANYINSSNNMNNINNNINNNNNNAQFGIFASNTKQPQLNQQMLFFSEDKENIQLNSNTKQPSLNDSFNNTPTNKRFYSIMQSQQLPSKQEQIITQQQQQQQQQPINTNNAFSFLNDYTSFNQIAQNDLAQQQQNQNEEDINMLKTKYESLVNQILIVEKEYIESHKRHIDDMVMSMKSEMNLINTVEKQANVDEYVDTLLNVFNLQEEKISQMKNNLLDFKNLLKEEIELSAKIAKVSQPSLTNNNNTTNSSLCDHSLRFDNMNNSNSINGSILGTSVKLEEMNDEFI